ncbi:MAG: ABC transporter ATP-binding protein [Propioniciclava sp.]|uniref:ABC transporter ATP-binding protein n=1 Tax=Propioniciclava sp. TaxID=2038686 RepID=UPI0039E5AAF4
MTVLHVRGLTVRYPQGVRAVRGIDLTVAPGELVALVGESGCGKSSVAKALLGALPPGTHTGGTLDVDEVRLSEADEATWRRVRGERISYVSQNPFDAMNPLIRVGANVAEAWRIKGVRPGPAQVADALARVGIDDAERRLRQYPHAWSGGMLQRAEIAAASAWEPAFIVADEPTAALDADLADAIIVRLREAASAVLLISHDLALVARHADRVLVMYGGRVVEEGTCADVLQRPRHPYSRALLAAIPRPGHGLPVPLEGAPPDLSLDLAGCSFAPRCALARSDCGVRAPELVGGIACPVTGGEQR